MSKQMSLFRELKPEQIPQAETTEQKTSKEIRCPNCGGPLMESMKFKREQLLYCLTCPANFDPFGNKEFFYVTKDGDAYKHEHCPSKQA